MNTLYGIEINVGRFEHRDNWVPLTLAWADKTERDEALANMKVAEGSRRPVEISFFPATKLAEV